MSVVVSRRVTLRDDVVEQHRVGAALREIGVRLFLALVEDDVGARGDELSYAREVAERADAAAAQIGGASRRSVVSPLRTMSRSAKT